MSYIWHTFFFDPVYNCLVFFIDVVRGGDLGLAIIFTVIAVKLFLLPLSLKSARTQLIMRQIQPQLDEIKEKYKDQRELIGLKTLEVFREAKVNPFSGILLMFIQIPILIALYFAVYSGGGVKLPDINTALLYSFIPEPDTVNTIFLGITDILNPEKISLGMLGQFDVVIKPATLLLALLAGVTQYIQTHLTLPKLAARKEGEAPSFSDEFTRGMHVQMRYILPPFIAVVAYTLSSAIALYFVISNLVSIAQEFVVRRQGLRE